MAVLIPGKTVCALTGKLLEKEDYIACFPHFINDASDPLWLYSDNCMLREAFEAWERRDEFLAQWADFEHSYVSRFVQRLLDSEDYLIEWVAIEKRVVIIFLKRGFTIGFKGKDWPAVSKAFFNAQQKEAVWDNPDGIVRLNKMVSDVQVEVLPHSPDGFGRDRILVSSTEWRFLIDSLRRLEKHFRRLF